MINLTPLNIPNTTTSPFPATLSGALDLTSLDMGSSLAVQLSANAQAGDVVALYGSNLGSGVTSLAQLTLIGSIGPTTPISNEPGGNPGPTGGSGQTPEQLGPPRYRYLYAVRVSGPTTGLTLTVTGQETAGTAGGGGGVTSLTATSPVVASTSTGNITLSAPTAIVQNGNAFGGAIKIGSTLADASDVTVQSAIGSGPRVLLSNSSSTATLLGTTAAVLGTTTIDIGSPGAMNIGVGASGASANRAGQLSYAPSIATWPGASIGDYQAWELILTGRTPGSVANETVTFNLSLENGKTYRISYDAVATSTSNPGVDAATWMVGAGVAPAAFLQQAGAITQLTNGLQPTTESLSVGAGGTWTLSSPSIASGPYVQWVFTTGATPAAVRVALHLAVLEVANAG